MILEKIFNPESFDYIFINLTTGLELLENINIPRNKIRFIRIPSSWCEINDLNKALATINDEFLLYLALGKKILVVDTSSRRGYISSALAFGIQYIEYAVNKIWFGKELVYRFPIKNYPINQLFREHYRKIPRWVRNRIKYYRKFLASKKPRTIYGYCVKSRHDGDNKYYMSIISNFYPPS